MADILNRLLLDTKNFDANLSNSKKGVNDYQGSVTNMAKTAGAGILKFAGAFGLAMGAGEAFNRVLNSSQTLGDMTARNMAALKTSVDEFFYSVGSGNLSSFINGLGGIIDKAKEAHTALDQLGNTQISHGVFSAANQTSISEGQYMAKNKFAPVNERLSGFGMWGNALASQKSANDALQRELINAATSAVESKIPSDINISLPDLMQAFETDLLNPSKRDETKATSKRVYNAHIAYANAHTDDAEAVRKDAESRKKYLVIHAMLEKYTDDELKAIAAQVQQYYQTTTALNSLAREYNETATEFNNSNKGVAGFTPVQSLEGYKFYTGNATKGGVGDKKEVPAPVGSIAAIDAELSKLNKELINATTTQARVAVQTTINELESKKISLQMEVEKNVFTQEHGVNKLSKVSNSEMAGFINSGSDKTAGSKGMNVKISKDKIKFPITKKDVSVLDDYQERLYGISSIMSSMSGVMGENAASWLNWGASLLSSISQAIPAIAKLIPALSAKAAAETAAENAAMGPFGWIAAGAAVAGILAVFAGLPKFANGGIVQGSSTFGDFNLARVNAGEMVLNGAQQGNLFRLLNGDSNAAPNTGGTVSFRIKGRDLEGVLKNYNNQKSKVR